MKKEDLIIGNIYHLSWDNGHRYLIMKIKDLKGDSRNVNASYIYINENKFTISYLYLYGRLVRKATFEEICWYNACEKAKKFIPLDQVEMNINYEIY